jgi:hypothetical protein
MEACHRTEQLTGAALNACADKLMRNGDAEKGVVDVWANCENGTLSVEYSPVPSSTYYAGPGSKHINHYKFPVVSSCGDDNAAAIAAFKALCPSYEGKIEADQ